MGGAGPVGWNDGSSSSKGEVRRSGVSSFVLVLLLVGLDSCSVGR